MTELRRIVLVRHGDTVGNSRERFHGSSDVSLSEEGRQQVRAAARKLRREVFDIAVASPLRRSWESASIATNGASVRIESDFREVHFGRWEGLTAEEIEATDPALYQDWRSGAEGFEYPSGEPRGEFRARVIRGLERLQGAGVSCALVVVHKGVIRTIAEHLLGEALEAGVPDLGGAVALTRDGGGAWFVGTRDSSAGKLVA